MADCWTKFIVVCKELKIQTDEPEFKNYLLVRGAPRIFLIYRTKVDTNRTLLSNPRRAH